MVKLYVCQSSKKDCGAVFLSKEGDYGWKLDVQDLNGGWQVPHGDHVESTLDELMPYLLRFVDETCQWRCAESDQEVTFWHVVSGEFKPAFVD